MAIQLENKIDQIRAIDSEMTVQQVIADKFKWITKDSIRIERTPIPNQVLVYFIWIAFDLMTKDMEFTAIYLRGILAKIM